jgi:membrane protein DedA with SNARE-associated domain
MDFIQLLTAWGVPLVFAAVMLEQGGLPVPAAPILVVAGALSDYGSMRPDHILLAAVAGCLVADHVWFLTGRRFGRSLLAGICRMSLSPDTCVRKTDDLIARHGAPLLLVAKFIPGVSAVSIPTAAAMGLSYRRFLLYDGLGSLLWCGVYVGAGMIFSREITRALAALSWIGGGALGILLTLLAIYVAAKFLHRRRLRRLHALVRISPEEVMDLISREPALVILDARSALARNADPRELPRSLFVGDKDPADVLTIERRDDIIVTFCTCPSEASAALLAEQLMIAGFKRVRVLTGGTDAIEFLSTRFSPGMS